MTAARWWWPLILVSGCASSAAAPPTSAAPRELPVSPAGIDREVLAAEVDVLADLERRACACHDAACAAAVDVDMVAYSERATINDPVTDVETWPEDLDAIANYYSARIFACASHLGVRTRADGVVLVRRVELFRDRACACQDAPCATRVLDRFLAFAKQHEGDRSPISQAQTTRMTDAGTELGECVRRTQNEQLMLDLRALRAAACACEDATCADEQQAAVQRWAEANREIPATGEAQLEQARELGAELETCLQAARGGDDGDAGSSP